MLKREYKKMYDLEDTHFWFIAKRYFIYSCIKTKLHRIKKCLDIGSGTGGTTKWLNNFFETTGIEYNSYALLLALKRGIKVIKGDAQHLPFNNSSFDLVTIFDVLYHKNVNNVLQVIKESNRVLKKNGYILITDSALNIFHSYHDQSLQGVRRFKIRDIQKQLEENNLKILKSSYIYFSIFPLVLFKRKVVNLFYKKTQLSDVQKINPLINKILICILKIEAILLKKISFPIGSSLIIFAQKK